VTLTKHYQKGVVRMKDIESFKQYLEGQGKSRNTIECYCRDVKQLRGWASNSLNSELRGLAQINLTYYGRKIKESGQAPVTVNRKIASINSFYKYLFEMNIVEKLMLIKPISIKKLAEFKALETKQIWKLRTEFHKGNNNMHIAILELLLNTGIRVSELTGLLLSDICLKSGYSIDGKVDFEALKRKKILIKVYGKGETYREIPLNMDTKEALFEYLKVRMKTENELISLASKSPLLIGQRGALKRNAINLILKKYANRVNVVVSAHKLRHSLGYALVKQGRPITTIQQILGHERITTTQIYMSTATKDKEDALEAVEW